MLYLLNNLRVICCDKGIVRNLVKVNKIGFCYKKDSMPSFKEVLKKLTNKKSNKPFEIYKKMFDYETILKDNIKYIEKIIKFHKNK